MILCSHGEPVASCPRCNYDAAIKEADGGAMLRMAEPGEPVPVRPTWRDMLTFAMTRGCSR